MRIARLDLARYGRFSGYSLDFGDKPAGQADFHIVYGLNEAGKSTAAAAILDLLFGIEKQSPYGAAETRANWHAYSAMRVGARLELKGKFHEVARLKRDKNSLVDHENRPLDETLIKSELAGVDRAAFRMMFSLDDESLEKGGEAILASRGDLGQLLFSASAGLAEMSGRLDSLRDEAHRFFKPRASKTELAEKKRELEALKEARDKADTLASTYAELIRQRDDAKAAYEAAAKALSERRARSDAIQRLLTALPHLAGLSDAEARLQPLADLPTPPAGWSEEVARLEAEAIKLLAQKEAAETAIRTLSDELDQIREDAAALAVAHRVDGWRELRSRYVSAKDIPVRQGELAGKRGAVAEILRRLGRPGEREPDRLILPVRTVGALEDLIAARSGVLTKLEAARTARDEANGALAEALEEAPPSDGGGPTIETLKTRLHAARRDDSAARLRAMRADMDKDARKLKAAMAALAPWSGDPEALALIAVPSEAEIAALRGRLVQMQSAHQQHALALAEKTREAERLKAEAAVAALADVVGDDVAAELRSAREAAWSSHRSTLSLTTADAFEAAMRRDDAAGAARIANARELAGARERAIKLAGVEAECARVKSDLDAADNSLRALVREIAAAMPAPPPAGREPLAFLDAWRMRRDEALGVIAALRETKEAMRRVYDVGERTREGLTGALRGASILHDPDADMEVLIDTAERAVAEEAKLESLRQKARERRADAARAETKLKAAADEDARWRAAWREACAASWLGENEAEPALNAVRQAVKALDELRVALKDCVELDHRIDAMERDRRLFAAEIVGVAKALGLDADGDDPAAQADDIEARVAQARENARRRKEKTKALQAVQEKLAEIVGALKVNAKLASAMTAFFAVDDLADVVTKLADCRRRDDLREAAGRETRAIIAANMAASFEAARAALECADRMGLEQELSALKTREADDVQANAESFAAFREASRRLDAVGGDDAVARIEERRRTILEEIKDGALRYLTLRAGVAAAEAALALYRDRHRGAMMERASKAFSEISRGAYRGLTAEPNCESETLIALGADGGSKTAEQLSKGARFQLYLALRVAGYHELAKARAPAPFVADDIMETFDHFRAEEALRLFADMGRVGQVIYFTHHLHLAEIAKRVCPEARVHELA